MRRGNGDIDVLLLDFCYAFDKVPYSHLFHKLHHYGICGALLLCFKSFLTEKSQYVILDNQKSCPTSMLLGVPQGTVLAPLLYINDLPSCVHSKVKLYTDDVCVLLY